ncbi:MAG: lipase family protein [Gallionella sp.]|nr:lipase family protein [Gallionella sp.]
MTITWHDLLHPGEASDFFSRSTFPEFQPEDRSYNPDNALWLAELSRLMYRDKPIPLPLGNHFPHHAVTQSRTFWSRETDTFAMLIEFDGKKPFAVLAFRGTAQCVKNFVTDLKICKIPLDQQAVNVHQGFLDALNDIWGKIEGALATLTCPVFFTGHSLGAALATLAATRYAPTALYTFGSPRVGDATLATALPDIPIYRLVVEADIAATVPPSILGYKHVGELKIRPAPVVQKRGLLAALDCFTHPVKPLADHAPLQYVDSFST